MEQQRQTSLVLCSFGTVPQTQALSSVGHHIGPVGEAIMGVFSAASACTLQAQNTHTWDWAVQE